MSKFIEKLLRLKDQLGLETDAQVGAMLGLTPPGFSARKTRNSFPTDKLYALAAKRPDLGLDVPYILSGVRSGAPASAQPANAPEPAAAPVAVATQVDLLSLARGCLAQLQADEPATPRDSLALLSVTLVSCSRAGLDLTRDQVVALVDSCYGVTKA